MSGTDCLTNLRCLSGVEGSGAAAISAPRPPCTEVKCCFSTWYGCTYNTRCSSVTQVVEACRISACFIIYTVAIVAKSTDLYSNIL